MFGDKGRRGGNKNPLLIIICVLLFALFIGILIWSKKLDRADAQRLRELSGDSAQASTQVQEQERETEQENISEVETVQDELQQESEENGQSEENNLETEEKNQEESSQPTGIVCWGDDLINGEESATYSYQVVLQNLMNEKGYSLPVIDKTLQGAGTLSMMTMAGVSQEEVQSFITAHQEAAQGAELPVTETGIRDLTAEETERTDLECIPVIFMGYYGGWNHDPNELAQQQEKILNTFPNTEKFVIAGTRPMDGTVDTVSLDKTMQEKWGEHYISIDTTIPHASASYEGQAEIASAVLTKLEELGYLSLDDKE
jgi:hypothetical protein